MGNKTVAPEKSRAPIYPITPTIHRTSVDALYPDVPTAPTRSPTPPVSFNSPTFAFPANSTIGNPYNIHPMPTTSPTFAFPVYSPTNAIPMQSRTAAIPIESPTTAIPIKSPTNAVPIESPTAPNPIESPSVAIPVKSPNPEIPIVSSTTGVPLNSPTPRIFVISPIPRTPIVSPSTAISVNSPTSRVPVPSPIPTVSVVSPSMVVSANSPASRVPVNSPIAAPVASSSPDIQLLSPIANFNDFAVISPDTSAVSPTLDLNNTPIASPVPTKIVVPVKPVTFSNKNRSIARITHDASTSPMARVVSNRHAIPPTSRPIEVARKQTIPKTSIPPPAPILKQTKHSILSSADRSSKWYQFEQKQLEEQKKFAEKIQPPQSPSKSPVSPSRISTPDIEITPVIPNIIAVPSFSLRSTAVWNPSQDPQILSERTQSIHTDLSIFKYYLTYNEAKHSIGDHTKATMFKMDTRLKQTPLPAPSLSFLTKNFNDGTYEIKYHSESTPSFEALGLQHDLENEPLDQFPKEARLHEKQQQRKLLQSSRYPNDDTPDSNNSLQFVTSTIFSQVDFPGLEQTSTANNRQPLTSILKKPSTQSNIDPQPTNKIFQEFQKIDFETNNNPSIVSFKLPSSSSSLRTKANQSISRSVRLTHRKK